MKSEILSLVAIVFSCVFIASALTFATIVKFHNNCENDGGRFELTHTTAICHY